MSTSKIAWVEELIAGVTGNSVTAKMVVDLLMEEGLLNIGYGDSEIDNVVEQFKEIFGTTKATRSDRFAASRLVRKHGAKSVVGIAKLLAANSQEKFAPVVGSVSQLETKWPNVVNFLRNVSRSEETIGE